VEEDHGYAKKSHLILIEYIKGALAGFNPVTFLCLY